MWIVRLVLHRPYTFEAAVLVLAVDIQIMIITALSGALAWVT